MKLIYEHISAYNSSVRRKPGNLLPLEVAICVSGEDLLRDGVLEFHGYQIAKHLKDIADHRLLTAYGTLYRALGRLEVMGFLTSRWEDPAIPAQENRPGRRLYTLTALGERVVADVRATKSSDARVRRRRRLARA